MRAGFFVLFILILIKGSAQVYFPLVTEGKVWSTFHDPCKSARYSLFTQFEGDNPEMICFTEDGILKFKNQEFDQCYVVTDTVETKMLPLARVYPDPNNGEFIVYLNGLPGNRAILEISEANGKQLLRTQLNANLTEYSLPKSAPNGLYFFHILGDNGIISIGKLLKQNRDQINLM